MAMLMKKCVAEYDEQCAEFAKLFVPKCEAHLGTPFCTEHSTCGRHPLLKDIYDDFNTMTHINAFLQKLEDGKFGSATEAIELFYNQFKQQEQ
jgi:hypothetical protein